MDTVQLIKQLQERKWVWRGILVLVFLVPVLLVTPHARSLVVRNAVITAYLSDFRAPISGEVTEIHLDDGLSPADGGPIMTLVNNRVDGSRVAGLDVRRNGVRLQVEQLRDQFAQLQVTLKERQQQLDSYVKAVHADVSKQLQQAHDNAGALDSALNSATAALDRARKLSADGLLSTADLDAADTTFQIALSEFSANTLEQKRLAQQLDEISQGVFQVKVPDGALLTRQMVQQLTLDVIQLQRQLHQDETRWQTAEAEFQMASEALDSARRAEIRLGPTQAVWDVYGSVGAWVNAGDPLVSAVDCSQLLVDIAVDDSILELIKYGQQVKLRLFGSHEYYSAKVILVRGSAGLDTTPVLAAEIQQRGQRKGRVLARLDESRLSGLKQESCAIGRSTYAEFEDIGLLRIFFYPMFH